MPTVAFKQVDVFTRTPYKGNPVAVVMDGTSLSTEQMQSIANWTNLSETTFVLPPSSAEADYRTRIFTPVSELPFAGHPTIGTAFALIESGIVVPVEGRLIQECGIGNVALKAAMDEGGDWVISFELPAPDLTILTPTQIDRLEMLLGCPVDRTTPPALVDVGARWIVAQTTDAKAVLGTTPDYEALRKHDSELAITGVCIFGKCSTGQSDIEVRSFAPSCGVDEDPVCGSGNGSVAAFIRHHAIPVGAGSRVVSSQGRILGRSGRIELSIADDAIFVSGNAVTCISGTIRIP